MTLHVNTLIVTELCPAPVRRALEAFRIAHSDRITESPEAIEVACADSREAEHLRAELLEAGLPRAAVRIVEPLRLSAIERLRAAS